jgi:Domain of unknown function (4846)
MSLTLLLAGYLWAGIGPDDQSVEARFAPPAGYRRRDVAPNSFGSWLRGLPLKPGRPPVHLFDGRLKSNHSVHLAVVDIDVGPQDLQQCADAVMRLRGEYLYSAGRTGDVAFHFTSGDLARFDDWAEGQRPRVAGSAVHWSRTGARDRSYRSFRGFMETVFRYAGSKSLADELAPVSVRDIRPGDVFVQGGFPGHAVLVVDVAERHDGRRVFVLAQSYMPAQEIHILKNPGTGDAWFAVAPGQRLETPEWSFPPDSSRMFPDRR